MSWKGQVGSSFQQRSISMTYKIVPFDLNIKKENLCYLATQFWNIYEFLDWDHDCGEKVLMCTIAIIDFIKSIIHMTLICTFDPLLNTIFYAVFWQLQQFPNFKRSYLKTSFIAHEYFFHYNLQLKTAIILVLIYMSV